MKKAFFGFLSIIQWSCWPAWADVAQFDTQLLRPTNFFEGSQRRNVTKDEITSFLRVIFEPAPTRLCGAFRVQSKDNRFLVASSRHCFDFDESNACERKQIRIATADSTGNYFFGSCKKIIVSSPSDDLFIMDVQLASSTGNAGPFFESKVKEMFPGYKLASYRPEPGTPLVISGFPTDPARQGQATISEKCEILSPMSYDSIYGASREERSKFAENDDAEFDQLPESIRNSLAVLEIVKLKHNCSVYMGNSGGPARIEGSMDIVGVPFDGWKGFFKIVPRYLARNLESTSGFVHRHRQVLDIENVIISDTSPKVRLRPPPTQSKKIQTI